MVNTFYQRCDDERNRKLRMTGTISQTEVYRTVFQCPAWRMPSEAEEHGSKLPSRVVLEPLTVVSGQHVEFPAIIVLWCWWESLFLSTVWLIPVWYFSVKYVLYISIALLNFHFSTKKKNNIFGNLRNKIQYLTFLIFQYIWHIVFFFLFWLSVFVYH